MGHLMDSQKFATRLPNDESKDKCVQVDRLIGFLDDCSASLKSIRDYIGFMMRMMV